ncbi:MAG: Ig-like domain-containing protein [Clostridia bacterium]|nr:Ig-like domain-containing protein [Clostridia bacterium]
MKKLLCALISIVLALSVLPSGILSEAVRETAPEGVRLVNSSVDIDEDGSDGYSGDYVVIYNPSTSYSGSASTGNMSGLIETEIGESLSAPKAGETPDRAFRIDVDPEMAEEAKAAGIDKPEAGDTGAASLSFNVGDTHYFELNGTYCPLSSTNVQFKVLAKGDHCYIWTPTSTQSNVWPLDSIDPTFADIAAAEFDSKFDLMQSSFGNHSNGSQGDGRLNILYYNIDDGWQPGQGYVAGFFSASDLYSNNMPILNIDTYPGVHYVNAAGEVSDDISRTYGTMVHEYQHLINYSEAGMTDTWVNEMMSAAAEEICYPGSSVYSRIQSWINYIYSENEDWANPPVEFPYVPELQLHNGFSMYSWNNDLPMDDLLVLYAQVSLYAQYIYSRYGNTTFRGIMGELAAGQSFVQGFENVTGMNASDFTANFRVALTANTAENVLGGIYGFRLQEGYDPAQYHGVENVYSLLGPVVFTGSQCSVKGGGAICVKPVGGVYNPPSGAASGLRYYGITRTVTEPEPVPLTGIDLDIHEAELHVGQTLELTAIPIPGNASDYTLNWISSDESVVTVEWDGLRATVTAVGSGEAVITVRATDEVLHPDMFFEAECVILVSDVIPYPRGDIDMNGTVNVTDAVLALRYSMGIITLTDEQLAIGDMDGSGAVNVTDALMIMRIAMGIA